MLKEHFVIFTISDPCSQPSEETTDNAIKCTSGDVLARSSGHTHIHIRARI